MKLASPFFLQSLVLEQVSARLDSLVHWAATGIAGLAGLEGPATTIEPPN